ncbi:indolepyruvate ferredoxin oxidoreductase subunit alpha [Halomonas urumqiensis]|uniref:Indolepyruvate ferredoxin oxidoreductase n=1 Tax=Halomonas urumqiensis TaxID=1684789 RepID=A0A2N7UCG5_9GAMM|nr:indolepyruvate ferredoxin oxidoreductase subunit alpha [Halomonas urumqiensis]PMR78095.1 indolepyruvate ferredoxin oxidoreductase [Halomonas urumqiensis]PTB03246.1 indolepyruvate ferredoxin oxidoreductase [Halomonas urumqiensis]GHE20599.1 indolepyruvate ferredoxin oxidoreductase subunit alpha [Halomonas urumqiensis]
MAERTFVSEVGKLHLGEGDTFQGEGILAVTKALLQSGVAYVGGYQGAPISHLMDVLHDAHPILEELGVHFENNASEAAAAAMLSASVNYPLRGAVAWKSTVGTNVASDALANLASGGVTGGTLIIVGEDYGDGSSIMQERTHAFAMKSQVWLLDPRPNLPSIVEAVEHGFELSEASNTPVMLELRIRACHVHGRFQTRDNRPPRFSIDEAIANPVRDTSRIVLPPASFAHEHEKVNARWPAAVEYIREHGLNEFFPGERSDIGLIMQGGLYNTVLRSLERLGLADTYGNSLIPLYVMNVTYPLVDDELEAFCADKRAVLMIEEGQPNYLEQAVASILRSADIQARLHGKDVLPKAGEYSGQVMLAGLLAFMGKAAPDLLAGADAPAAMASPTATPELPPRPPGFCTGCPERPIFTALKLVERELGQHHVSCDIGCHLFSILPPFNIGNTTMGYGLGASAASAFHGSQGRRAISVMGDGGFWHNGLTSGVANAVFNNEDSVLLIVDNFYSAATGGQDIPSSRAENPIRHTNIPIEQAVKGVGVKWLRVVDDTYDVQRMKDILSEALTTEETGPKVIIAQSECMLNLQRREKPKVRQALAEGKRTVRVRFGVDSDTCTGDHSCIRISGCPSLSIRDNPDPLREDPIAQVDNTCVGCGLCGEAAHAAVLCPSFYRARVISHPNRRDRLFERIRQGVISRLQAWREKRLAQLPPSTFTPLTGDQHA